MSAEDDRLFVQKAAEQGDAKAQFLLGLWYFSGQGGLRDYAKAAEWFSKAAEQGDANAQSKLGLQYFTGQGVPEDKAKAAEWFSKAAKQGDARAQFYMGFSYESGQGVSEDNMKAAEWYGKAAEQGDADAQYELGLLYSNGQGVPKDSLKAEKLLRKAAEQGNEKAKDYLAKVKKSEEEKKAREEKAAAERLRIKAEQGDANAQYELGLLWLKGLVPYDEAIEWFEKAAKQGHEEAKRETERAADSKKAKEEEARKKKEKEKKHKMGRIIAPALAVLSIIFCLIGNADDPGGYIASIVFSIFVAIPFLVLYFSYSDRKILRGLFLAVAVFFSIVGIVFASNSTPPEGIFIVMCISFMASCITAMIFPRD